MISQDIPLDTVFDIRSIENISYYRCVCDYFFSGESHPSWEFLYVDRGNVIVTAGNDTYFMQSGEMAFHCPNEFHSFKTSGEADVIVIAFSCDSPAIRRLERKVLRLHRKEKEHFKMLIDEAQLVYQYFEKDPPTVNMLKRTDAPWASDQMIKCYLEQFFIYICRRDDNVGFEQRAVAVNRPYQGYVQAQLATEYLQEHYSEHITLEKLAATLGMSVSQIKLVFREYVGQSMVRYLTALRIRQAKRLIREDTLNFTQIAEKIGYANIYYFSALFKKHTGMTLTEYSKSIKD